MSMKSGNFIFLLKGQKISLLCEYFGFWHAVLTPSCQGIFKMTSFGKIFLKIIQYLYFKWIQMWALSIQMRALCTKVWAAPRNGVLTWNLGGKMIAGFFFQIHYTHKSISHYLCICLPVSYAFWEEILAYF